MVKSYKNPQVLYEKQKTMKIFSSYLQLSVFCGHTIVTNIALNNQFFIINETMFVQILSIKNL